MVNHRINRTVKKDNNHAIGITIDEQLARKLSAHSFVGCVKQTSEYLSKGKKVSNLKYESL